MTESRREVIIPEHELGAAGEKITGDTSPRVILDEPENPTVISDPEAGETTGDPVVDQAVVSEDWGRFTGEVPSRDE